MGGASDPEGDGEGREGLQAKHFEDQPRTCGQDVSPWNGLTNVVGIDPEDGKAGAANMNAANQREARLGLIRRQELKAGP